jgi:glycosyltransferase involved in cell wall biosynthesis
MTRNVLALSYLFPNRAHPGYGVFVLNRLRAVSKRCNLKVIAPVQWYPLMGWLRGALGSSDIPAQEQIQGLDVYHPRFAVIPRYLKFFDALSYFWAVRGVVKRLRTQAFEFDLIDVHWTYPDIVGAYWLARKRGCKFIVTVRGHEALYLEENTLRRRMLKRFLRRADAVVALSAELRDKVIELGVEPQRAHVILNGVDLSRFSPLDRRQCREQLGLPLDRKIALSVGRLAAGKGHQDLIRALPALADLNVELYIIGGVNPEDNFEPVLRGMIKDLKLNNVHLVDGASQDELARWYSAADVFCLATKREGCPNVMLEALACGTPAVVNAVGAVPEVITSGTNGFTPPVEDIPALEQTLRAALTRDWDREMIARDMKRWGWDHCAEQVEAVYRAMLEPA